MGKPVTYAKLKNVFFIPEVGQVDNTLPPNNKQDKMKNLKMELQDNGSLLLTWTVGNFLRSYTVSESNIDGCLHPPVPAAQAAVAPVPEPSSGRPIASPIKLVAKTDTQAA